jgi:hypothetical protein
MSRIKDGRESQNVKIPNMRSKLREFLDKQRLIKMQELDSMGGKKTRRRRARTQRTATGTQRPPRGSSPSPVRRPRTTKRSTGGY